MRGRGKREKERSTLASPVVLFLFAFFLFPIPLYAQNALVLIRHDRAGPNLPSADTIHPEWIRWPSAGSGSNDGLLALACGVDLRAEKGDFAFHPAGPDVWTSLNGARLQLRGFFDARTALLGGVETVALENRHDAVPPSVLLLALDAPDGRIRGRSFAAPLPERGLVVLEAEKWDDVRTISQRVRGRTLVIELPTQGEGEWTRFWKRGKWPVGVPTESDVRVPGLVRARSALDLLLRPERFAWSVSDAGGWGGANRWLEHGHGAGMGILLGWFALGTLVVAWALAQVMNEDRGPFVSEMLVLLALSPAALVLAGAAERLGGLEAWPILLILALGALYGFSVFLGFALRRTVPEAHPLWPVSLVGLVTIAAVDPLWSDLSGRFGPIDVTVPGGALGALVSYLAGSVAFARGRWFGRALAVAMVLWGVSARPWWVDGHAAFLLLPAAVVIAAEGLFRPTLLLVFAFLPTGLLSLARGGIAWNPKGLVGFADEQGATNLWWTYAFVVSPGWLGLLGFLAMTAVVGNRFLAYRLRKLLRQDPRLRVLPWLATATLALGVTDPVALLAVPILVFGALLLLAYDGLRANA